MNKNQQRLINYCYDLLARRRYSIHEMVKKLEGKNDRLTNICTDAELKEILEALLKANLINDQDYAFFYIENQVRNKPAGKIKLRFQLRRKGISEDIIVQTLNKAELNELELANDLLRRKARPFAHQQLKEDKIKNRLLRYLASNGFNGATSYQAYKTLLRSYADQ